jgi:hypothetical protein
VPVQPRLRCIEAVRTFFAKLFVPRCAPLLSHLSEAPAGTLSGVCYMWCADSDSIRPGFPI